MLCQVIYEDILPYQDFAVRLPQHMMYSLPKILGEQLSDENRVGAVYGPAIHLRAASIAYV